MKTIFTLLDYFQKAKSNGLESRIQSIQIFQGSGGENVYLNKLLLHDSISTNYNLCFPLRYLEFIGSKDS